MIRFEKGIIDSLEWRFIFKKILNTRNLVIKIYQRLMQNHSKYLFQIIYIRK